MTNQKERLRCGLAVAAAAFSVLSITCSALGIISASALFITCAVGTMGAYVVIRFML